MVGRQGVVRKPYAKPEVTRVDLIADEVALASCKAAFISTHSTPNAGSNRCNTGTCKTRSNS
jgi:hypothetical protein